MFYLDVREECLCAARNAMRCLRMAESAESWLQRYAGTEKDGGDDPRVVEATRVLASTTRAEAKAYARACVAWFELTAKDSVLVEYTRAARKLARETGRGE